VLEDSEDKVMDAARDKGYGEEIACGEGGQDGDKYLNLSVMFNTLI
jgi:hypothetical protein